VVNSASTARKASRPQNKALIPFKWKPGQSGNPKGRTPGSRNKLREDFLRDLSEAWVALGKPALLATAWTEPAKFVTIVASLMPRDVTVAVTHTVVDQLTDAQLADRLREIDHRDDAEAPQDAEILQ
jgi:hypothetical protein